MVDRKRTRRDIKPGNLVWAAPSKAADFSDRIHDPRRPMLCKALDRSEGVTVCVLEMPDGSPFKNGETTIRLAKRVLVPNPPTERAA